MRVLLDENLPVELSEELIGHVVDAVSGLDWGGIANGELLKRAGSRHQALLTMDRNIEHQQSIDSISLGVILVLAPSNRIQDLRPLLPKLLDALDAVRPGTLLRVRR